MTQNQNVHQHPKSTYSLSLHYLLPPSLQNMLLGYNDL